MVTIVRIVRYPQAVAADLRSHSRGVGFFTVIAAFGVFGSQPVLQMEAAGFAVFCWIRRARAYSVPIFPTYLMTGQSLIRRASPQ